MKKNQIGDSEKALSGLFIGFVFVGMILGAVAGLMISLFITGNLSNLNLPLDQMKGNHLWHFLAVPGLVLGVPCFSIPLFLLCLRPFYTKEAVSKFAVKGRREELRTNPLIAMIYRSTFFWIDLFYSGENGQVNGETS